MANLHITATHILLVTLLVASFICILVLDGRDNSLKNKNVSQTRLASGLPVTMSLREFSRTLPRYQRQSSLWETDDNEHDDQDNFGNGEGSGLEFHCPDGEFVCDEELCLGKSMMCDGVPDCIDGMDEADCIEISILGDFNVHHQLWLPSPFTDHPGELAFNFAIFHDLEQLVQHPTHMPNCLGATSERTDMETDGTLSITYATDTTTCTSNQWTCYDGSCIPQDRQCDGRFDCPDFTDEHDCKVCNDEEWMCSDGVCISAQSRCNDVYDCLDHSDEENCLGVCRPEEWQCKKDGSCIPKQSQCNGFLECPDGSDERGCTPKCRPGEWQCRDFYCVPEYQRCDGIYQCPDFSDEINCPGIWKCQDGWFIYARKRCDGRRDCFDGTDELSC